MKTKSLLSVTLLFFIIAGKAQVYNGFVDLKTQAQVDAFNYTEINGDLRILYFYEGFSDPIKNINHLSMLTRINGRLFISNTRSDTTVSFKGLSNVTYIRTLINTDKVGFAGLNSINRIDTITDKENLYPNYIYNNAPILTFSGLDSLKSIGSLYLTDYLSTINFQGLNNVETIHDLFTAQRSYNCSGLENLKQITGTFTIKDGGQINFSQMNSLKYINYFDIRNIIGTDTLSFIGLENLTRIDTLKINTVFRVANLNSLSGVTSMQKLNLNTFGTVFCDQPGLSLDFMNNITAIKDLIVEGVVVGDLNGLRNIQLVTGNLIIRSNPRLINCCAIKDLLSNGGVRGAVIINFNGHACDIPYNYPLECDNMDSIFTATCDIHSDSLNVVQSKFFIDNNSNTVFDGTDIPIPNKNITVTYPSGNTFSSQTDNNGKTNFYIKRGNFQFTLTNNIKNYTTTPLSISKTFTTLSNADSIQFIAHPTTIFNDVCIQTVIGGRSRPGRQNELLINVANIGTQVSNGFLKFKIDNRATVLSANPVSSFSIGDTLVWNINNLLQLNYQNIYVQYLLASNLQNGDTLYHFAKFVNSVTDATPANNSFVAPDPVTTAIDPNDKSVSNQFITPGMVASGDYLTYTIRFQNTGNDTAFRVEIKDTLSDNLDWNSIDMIGASHPYTFKQENGKYITFTFNNILLPDSNVNEIKSHGFVSFKIKPKSTLPLGAAIPNTGYIYFDLNAPVKTNTVQTTVQLLSNTISNKQFNGKLFLYPNPNNGEFTLSIESKESGVVQINLTDITGKIVYAAKENHSLKSLFYINSINLPAGMYLVTVFLNNDTTSQKLLIEK